MKENTGCIKRDGKGANQRQENSPRQPSPTGKNSKQESGMGTEQRTEAVYLRGGVDD